MHISSLFPWCALLLSACTVYRPAPVDLARDAAEWRQLSAELCPAGKSLTRAELQHIGLLLNPALNKARLSYAQSTSVAEFAGLWQDPSLSAELEHVMRQNMNNYSIAPSLSIPVTGLPRLARRVAEQYRESDYWNMVATERDFLRDLDVQLAKLLVLHRKSALAQEQLHSLRADKQRMEQLHRMGEISFADYQVACQRLLDTEQELLALGQEHEQQHAELVSMLGLHPDARRVESAEQLPEVVPPAVPLPEAAALAEHPSLKAALATYGASETELQAEIRRQYPELSLSPSRVHEEGETRLGAGVELSLPLWNRNREAIAKAQGNRSIRCREALDLWRGLQQRAAALGDQQQLLAENCRSTAAGVAERERAEQHHQRLYDMGECSLPELAQARYETYQRRMTYLDCLNSLLEIQVKLQYLNPSFS